MNNDYDGDEWAAVNSNDATLYLCLIKKLIKFLFLLLFFQETMLKKVDFFVVEIKKVYRIKI